MRKHKMHSQRPCVHCGLPSDGHRAEDQRCVSGGPPRFYTAAFGSGFANVPVPQMPPLGDESSTWSVVMTEPEINAAHAAVGFLRAACHAAPIPICAAWWDHYGPTLEALSDRLAAQTEGHDAQPPIRAETSDPALAEKTKSVK